MAAAVALMLVNVAAVWWLLRELRRPSSPPPPGTGPVPRQRQRRARCSADPPALTEDDVIAFGLALEAEADVARGAAGPPPGRRPQRAGEAPGPLF